ncbi:MAG: hypothetical protein JRJ38_01275 [Deltaproteobacteria bacterium]|nr:hypothetical protein [Deltaproteobacteria bacterium]
MVNDFKKILAILQEVEDHKETKILSQSVEFKKMVKKGLEDIKGRKSGMSYEVYLTKTFQKSVKILKK